MTNYILIGIILGWVFFNIIIPIGDWILRMIGYGIFEFKITPWRKAKSWKHTVRYLFVVIPALCLRESGTIGSVWASEVSANDITWRPYFHYRRHQRRSRRIDVIESLDELGEAE